MQEREGLLFRKLPRPARYGLYSGLTALGVLSSACLPSKGNIEKTPVQDNSTNEPVAERVEKDLGQRFLDFPFNPGPQMKLVQGWIYSGSQVNDGEPHNGIDYILGSNPNDFDTWFSFPVSVAAGGDACSYSFNSDYGRNYSVKVQHPNHYETRNLHMDRDSIKAQGIPECSSGQTKSVKSGDVLGEAGDTGTPKGWVHLHFEVVDPSGKLVDPYGIAQELEKRGIKATKDHYPDPNFTNGNVCGEQTLWRNCPVGKVLGERVEATPESTVTQVEVSRAFFDREFSQGVFDAINSFWRRKRWGLEPFRHNEKLSKIAGKLVLDFIDLEDFEDLFDGGAYHNYKSLANEVGYRGDVKGTIYVSSSIYKLDERDPGYVAGGFGESSFQYYVLTNSLYEELSVACLGREDDGGNQTLCIFVAGAPYELKIDGELKQGYYLSPEVAIRSELKLDTKNLTFDEKCEAAYCGSWIQTEGNKRLYTVGALPDALVRFVVEKSKSGWHIIDRAFQDWPEGFSKPFKETYVGFEDRSRDVIFGITWVDKVEEHGGFRIGIYFENRSGRTISWTSDMGNQQIYVEASGYRFPSMDAGGRFAQDFPEGMPNGARWYGWHDFSAFLEAGAKALILHYPGRLPIKINFETGQTEQIRE